LHFSEDVPKRFQAYGWQTIEIDGHNHDQIAHAIEAGQRDKEHPTLILAKTHIGFGAPAKQDTAEAHGSPLGVEELNAAKRNLHWPEKDFYVPESVAEVFHKRVEELKKEYDVWGSRFLGWEKTNTETCKRMGSSAGKGIAGES